MKFKIGFADKHENKSMGEIYIPAHQLNAPRKSVVQVYFPSRNMTLAYYNDQFDLHRRDLVYVEGKLEGKRGSVVDVNYNFKIKVSDYKRVIAVVDTSVSGQFFMAGSHFVTFDPNALPISKVRAWFKAPVNDEDEFVSGSDDTSFRLDELIDMHVTAAVVERGYEYYMDNKVRYICVDGTRGYAIVEGSEAYEVEFTYRNGEISNLTCSCFCSYNCKHEVATIIQLKNLLELIEKHYAEQFGKIDFFAAVYKATLFQYAIDGKETGTFTL